MAETKSAARRAAELMAILCSSAATEQARRELAALVATERITLADFTFALSELTDERGAAAYSWEQSSDQYDHDWHLLRAEDVPITRQTAELDVMLRCERCGTEATFRAGAVPPCHPGQLWQYTGTGWQRTEETAHDR